MGFLSLNPFPSFLLPFQGCLAWDCALPPPAMGLPDPGRRWLLTLVVGGDSPSAVIDFSSIFSSLVSSTAGFSTTSCFFSGLAVLAGQQEEKLNVYWMIGNMKKQTTPWSARDWWEQVPWAYMHLPSPGAYGTCHSIPDATGLGPQCLAWPHLALSGLFQLLSCYKSLSKSEEVSGSDSGLVSGKLCSVSSRCVDDEVPFRQWQKIMQGLILLSERRRWVIK